MDKIDLAYMAGLFDGEGCVSISSHKDGRSHLQCTMNIAGKVIPALFKRSFGGGVYKINKAKDYHQQLWCWNICSNNAMNFLIALMPYLKLKLAEAYLAIEYQDIVNNNKGKRLSREDRLLRLEIKVRLSNLKKR